MNIDGFMWSDATRELTLIAGGDRQTFIVSPGIAEALMERLGEGEK